MTIQSRPRFIQIHTLTSYAGVLLYRDDSGMAKRLPFGGTTRTRVTVFEGRSVRQVNEGRREMKA